MLKDMRFTFKFPCLSFQFLHPHCYNALMRKDKVFGYVTDANTSLFYLNFVWLIMHHILSCNTHQFTYNNTLMKLFCHVYTDKCAFWNVVDKQWTIRLYISNFNRRRKNVGNHSFKRYTFQYIFLREKQVLVRYSLYTQYVKYVHQDVKQKIWYNKPVVLENRKWILLLRANFKLYFILNICHSLLL